jgi:hypothetical protein
MDEIEEDKQTEYLLTLFRAGDTELFINTFMNSANPAQEYCLAYVLGSHDSIKQALSDCIKLIKGEDIG